MMSNNSIVIGNPTFLVATEYCCDDYSNYQEFDIIHSTPRKRTTMLGCLLLRILQDMYQFQMTYVKGSMIWDGFNKNASYNTQPDIYARPLPFTEVSAFASPIQSVIERRYGFVLLWQHKQESMAEAFFTLPFSRTSWMCLLIMTFLVLTPAVYWLGVWESKVLGRTVRTRRQEYSLVYAILVVVGSCCQHIPSFYPYLGSRRIACLTLFIFAYVVHSYYTSNLLSHLVNDKDTTISLNELVDSDYTIISLKSLKLDRGKQLYWFSKLRNFSRKDLLYNKLAARKTVSIAEALNALKTQKVALLSDYVTAYPYFHQVLKNNEICELVEVEIISNLHEYILVSKRFPLKDKFKIGMLRIIETGILKRLKRSRMYSPPLCHRSVDHHIGFPHLTGPLVMLTSAVLLSLLIMAAEFFYYRFCIVRFPYLD